MIQLLAVALGNPFDGMTLHGPFDNSEVAEQFADDDPYLLIDLAPPPDDYRMVISKGLLEAVKEAEDAATGDDYDAEIGALSTALSLALLELKDLGVNTEPHPDEAR